MVPLASYGGKYVLLNFWGHWCGPCVKSFPRLKQRQQTYGDKLALIGVAAEYAADKPLWLATIKANGLNWTHLSELNFDKGNVNNQYNITAFPTYFLLNKEGILLERSNELEPLEQKPKTLKP